MIATINGKKIRLRGIYFSRRDRALFSTITNPLGEQERIYLPVHCTPKEAALIYDKKAIQYGKKTNFLKPLKK